MDMIGNLGAILFMIQFIFIIVQRSLQTTCLLRCARFSLAFEISYGHDFEYIIHVMSGALVVAVASAKFSLPRKIAKRFGGNLT